MCGICGYINIGREEQDTSVLQNMVKTLHHRGPDSQGFFEDKEHQVFLGHSRLSIIDISDNGRQPMSLGCLTIVFNGEIYNYQDIKKELMTLGHSFKTNSDTEVILHSFLEWGASCVNRFIGMFAFAIYNSDTETLLLFRDRAGVKPLYYYFDQNVFIFGSELKAFHQNPLFPKTLNYDSLGLYMQFGYIPTPHCVFMNTYKLVQGSYLEFNIKTQRIGINKYWELKPYYLKPKLDISYDEAIIKTEQLLKSAFQYRMVSDVPVGVFLSAGFDSTCVAALLQSQMSSKLRTFTIGFESGNNEAPMANEIAKHLGTDHTEHYCCEKDALNIIKDLPFYYDEPFADSSAIPTILVSRIARQHVKVALSADGGDEIFAGYNSYCKYIQAYKMIDNIPDCVKKTSGHIANYLSSIISAPSPHRAISILSDTLLSEENLAKALSDSIHINGFNNYKGNIFCKEIYDVPSVYAETNDRMTPLSRLLYADYIQYMQDDVLVKVDRASMSTSLEGRNPLLDHRIVEFSAQLPDDYKFCNGVKKKILKDIVYKYVPSKLIDKPKTGFSVPLSKWLNEGLQEYVEHFMSTSVVDKYNMLNIGYVNYIKNRFKAHPETAASDMWKILQLQMWYDKWINK